jgi:hypothetical protein
MPDKMILRLPFDFWLQGEDLLKNALGGRKDKKRCCLGHLCHQAGITDKQLGSKGDPSKVHFGNVDTPYISWLHDPKEEHRTPDDVLTCMLLNDDKTPIPNKLVWLREIFARYNIEIKYIPKGGGA